MTAAPPIYDLVLLLDAQAEEPVRTQILSDVRESVSAQGELLRHDQWGDRALAYPIEHKQDAEYHLIQFHAHSPELLHGLDRTLRITDGVVRFRIVKLKPGTPEAPDLRNDRSAGRIEVEAPPEPEPEPAAVEPA
jgi:small subunit ribosomal protein S6